MKPFVLMNLEILSKLKYEEIDIPVLKMLEVTHKSLLCCVLTDWF